MTTFETSIGTVDVLHRLALGVEVRDALTDARISAGLCVAREVDPRLLPPKRPRAPRWPCRDLVASAGRFSLRHDRGLPVSLTIRVDDPLRRFVPRRFEMPLWTLAEVEASDATPPGQFVPARARMLRTWLSPASAYPLPGGITGIRGRVEEGGVALRWPRLTAIDGNENVLGRAHGDERGEFVLILSDIGLPPPPQHQLLVFVILRARAPDERPEVDPDDRLADLAIEDVPRTNLPLTTDDPDTDLLRGRTPPPGYVVSTAPRQPIRVDLGGMTYLSTPVEYAV